MQKAFQPARSEAYEGKKLGFLEAFSIGVGGMIGGGIFAVLGLTLYLAKGGAPLAMLIAGLVALATSYSYAKLSVRYPSEGGTVEFIVRGLGNGLLAGWLNNLLLLSYVIMLVLYSYAFGAYASGLLFGGENWFTRTGFAWLVLAAFTVVNALGAYVTGKVEDFLVLFKVGVLLGISGLGLIVGNPARLAPSNWTPLIQLVVGGFVIFLAYEGFELIANAAKDVKDPERTLPRAFYAAVLFVTFIYVLVSAVAVMNLTYKEIVKYKDYVLAVMVRPFLGEVGFVLVALAAMASTASAINATIYGSLRISYIVAKYGEMPRKFERRVWKGATEGLVLLVLSAAIGVAALPLKAISLAGSLGFLLVYAAVNYVNFKLRELTNSNAVVPFIAFLLCSMAAVILVTFNLNLVALEGAIAVFVGALLIELYASKVVGRKISSYIDKELEEREARRG